MERRYQEVSKFLTWDCQVPLLPKFGVSQVITHLSYDDKIIILAQCMLDIFFLPVFPDCIRSCMLISLHLTPVTCINMKLKLCESEMNTSSVLSSATQGQDQVISMCVALARMDSLFVAFLFLNVAAIMEPSDLVPDWI